MTAAVPGCARCGELRTGPEAPAVATAGPVRATAEGRPLPPCTRCGAGQPDRDALIAAIGRAMSARLVGGSGRPGAAHCGVCRGRLDLPMRATSRALTLEADGAAPFTVTVDLPLVRCGACAVDNVPPQLVAEVDRSVRAACGLPPDSTRRGAFNRLRRPRGRGSRGRPSLP